MSERTNQYRDMPLPTVAIIATMDIGKVMHGQPMPKDALDELTHRLEQVVVMPSYDGNDVLAAFTALHDGDRATAQAALTAYVMDAQAILNPPSGLDKVRLREMFVLTEKFAQAFGKRQRPAASVAHPLKLVVG